MHSLEQFAFLDPLLYEIVAAIELLELLILDAEHNDHVFIVNAAGWVQVAVYVLVDLTYIKQRLVS